MTYGIPFELSLKTGYGAEAVSGTGKEGQEQVPELFLVVITVLATDSR